MKQFNAILACHESKKEEPYNLWRWPYTWESSLSSPLLAVVYEAGLASLIRQATQEQLPFDKIMLTETTATTTISSIGVETSASASTSEFCRASTWWWATSASPHRSLIVPCRSCRSGHWRRNSRRRSSTKAFTTCCTSQQIGSRIQTWKLQHLVRIIGR